MSEFGLADTVVSPSRPAGVIPVTPSDPMVREATVGTSATRASVSRLRAASAGLSAAWPPPKLDGSGFWLETRT